MQWRARRRRALQQMMVVHGWKRIPWLPWRRIHGMRMSGWLNMRVRCHTLSRRTEMVSDTTRLPGAPGWRIPSHKQPQPSGHFVNLCKPLCDSRRPGAHLVRTPLPLCLIPLPCYPTPLPCYPTPLPCSPTPFPCSLTPLPCSLTPSLCSPTPLPCSPTPLPCSLSGRVTHFINSIAHHRHVLLGGACCFEVRIDPYLITLLCSLTQLLLCLTITACGRLPPLLSSFTRPSSYSRLLAACMSFVACFICQGRQETLRQTASR